MISGILRRVRDDCGFKLNHGSTHSLLAVVAAVLAGVLAVLAVLARVHAVLAVVTGGHFYTKSQGFFSPKHLVRKAGRSHGGRNPLQQVELVWPCPGCPGH